ncbi:MAG: molybdopterin oxidoreductase family protein [Myxococcales bacterium]
MRAKERFGPEVELVRGACPHDCPDTCSWQVAVDRNTGRALELWGDPEHPVTQGVLCTKVDRYLDRTYHPQRLTQPMRRSGPKGAGLFEPVSWDTAFREIAARLHDVIACHGAESVLPYSYAGTMGYIQGEGMAARFFHRMGASLLARTICSEAGFEGLLYTTGRAMGVDPELIVHSDLIWIWGSNTLTSNVHLWPFVQEARKRGARLVVIDPVRTRTAKQADTWVGIKPGTDGALALGMMHVLVREDLVDHAYVERATVGFSALAERVQSWTPERTAEITQVPAEIIVELARSYGRARAPAIRVNYGMQRHAGGGMAVRNIACLPALVGAWQRPGGGILLSASGHYRLDTRGLQRPDLLGDRRPRTFNMNRLGDALSHAAERRALAHYRPRPVDRVPSASEAGPAVHALIVYNTNPAAVAPDQGAVVEGLSREDLFSVVLEHFQTDTADYADYLLPATTQLEHWDLVRPYGHLRMALNRPAIAPVGESRPNSEIFRGLARAMGYTDACFGDDDQRMIEVLLSDQTAPHLVHFSWPNLLRDGYARVEIGPTPFAEGGFPTPSGKCELYSQRMLDDGYDPLPDYTPPNHARATPSESEHYPLLCLSPPAHGFLNSTFVNVERLQKREREPHVLLHPQDAAPRGLSEGQRVRVYNACGELELPARIALDVVPGTLVIPGVWWSKFSPDKRNVNRLVSQAEADMGAGALFYDVRVNVEPAADSERRDA